MVGEGQIGVGIPHAASVAPTQLTAGWQWRYRCAAGNERQGVRVTALVDHPEPAATALVDQPVPARTARLAPWGLAALLAATAALYLWNLSASGYGNTFYAAAAQAG